MIMLSGGALAVTFITPTSGTNYSNGTIITFNISYFNATDITNPLNATFYYNLTGTWNLINKSICFKINDSLGECRAVFNVSTLTDGAYTINVTIENQTANISALVTNVGFDFSIPQVSAPTLPVNGGNYSGTIILRVLATDTVGITYVMFNVTNSSGGQNITYNASRDGSTDYWNVSINTAVFADGNNYWYFKHNNYMRRFHRFTFTKGNLLKLLNEPQMTEWELALSLKMDRIWDCGNMKFELLVEKQNN